MVTPTSLSINSYPTPLKACEGPITPPTGVLMDGDTSLPIPNKVITVKYNGNSLGFDITDINGTYTILNAYILEAGTFDLTASFAGDATYEASSIDTPITIQYCKSDEDLAARFWISKWRVPGAIEADTYGALLCVDPNGVRTTNKGPIIYVLDDLNFSPGLTEKSGVMRCQINDNANGTETHPEGRVDMELLKEGTIWIQDDDEFWIGIQRGPDPGANEPHGAWDPSGGGDGEGAGRQWLMGGYVNKRYYRYGGNGDITAVIIGKDYMDVWKDQLFGTPSLPRNYRTATDIGMIAYQVVDDLNSFQPVGWQYTRHPTYFPYAPYAQSNLAFDYPAGATSVKVEDSSQFTWALAGIPALLMDSNSQEIMRIVGIDHPNNTLFFPTASPTQNTYTMAAGAKILQSDEVIGIEWKKEFNQEAADKVMTDICDEASYEWRIDYRRRVMLYPRTSAPSAPSIRFNTNIRNLPEIVMGDTTERITHVIVTDATVTSIPPDVDAWCTNTDTWPDLTNNPRSYSAAFPPAPANPADNIYADPTLIIDDEVAPALCFQNDIVNSFNLHLSIYRDGAGEYQYSKLHLDLREWGWLKFRFRHPTRTGPGNIYRLQLHTGGVDPTGGEFFNNRYQYEFGEGTQEVDTIDSNEWTEIELLLPEVDVDGNIRLDEFGNPLLHGWTAHDAWDVIHGVDVPPDPTDINWLSIYVLCEERPPGHGPGQMLQDDADADEEYLEVANPEYFASGSTRKTFLLPNTYILEDAGGWEDVQISGVGLLNIPAPDNLELNKGVINDYKTALGAQISVRGGWTICFSQLHFQRRLRYEPTATAPTPPYRYRMMISKEMESLNEAVARADGIIAQEEEAMRPVKVLIDGDPLFEAGYSSQLHLDVDPFDNVSTFIDDIRYELGPDLDFRIILTLGEGDRRSRELTELSVLDAHDRQLRNLGLGRSKTRVLK